MNSAKQDILNRIRSANSSVVAGSREPDYERIERHYRMAGSLPGAEVVECFIDRLHDYGCNVYRCPRHSIADMIASILRNGGIAEMLVSPGVPAEWRPDGVRLEEDHPEGDGRLSYEELDTKRGVLTGCAAAIALTGSIILTHTSERRALTLIPDYHLCVVLEEQVTETVPEALRRVASLGNVPITTIAGPSATADIEMTRIKGVHGPRSLDVILAGA